MKKIGDIIASYRKQNNLSQTQLSELLMKNGFKASNKAVWSWEKNTSEPGASLLLFLCKQLGITDIYQEYYGMNPDNLFSELNEEGKEKALEYIQLLVDSGKFQKTAIIPFRRTLRLFDIPASAGVGNFLDDGNFTEVEVGEEVPTTADFGIRISGDSMEPRFVNGQIVWVQKLDTLNDGDIGIFFLDGNAYCKKLQDTETGLFLLSLNSKYEPIAVSENQTFKIFGKVVG
ncbi:MAG: LexA family transcriptional regulator [Alphaproteobacteria bacterium]|nr:LexA family transcriptional regulator [Alphaproteobacteria bacterium]